MSVPGRIRIEVTGDLRTGVQQLLDWAIDRAGDDDPRERVKANVTLEGGVKLKDSDLPRVTLKDKAFPDRLVVIHYDDEGGSDGERGTG